MTFYARFADYGLRTDQSYKRWMESDDKQQRLFSTFYMDLKLLVEKMISIKYRGISWSELEDIRDNIMEELVMREVRRKESGDTEKYVEKWQHYVRQVVVIQLRRHFQEWTFRVVKSYADHDLDEVDGDEFTYVNEYWLSSIPSQEKVYAARQYLQQLPDQINRRLMDNRCFTQPYQGILNHIAFCLAMTGEYEKHLWDVTSNQAMNDRVRSMAYLIEQDIRIGVDNKCLMD